MKPILTDKTKSLMGIKSNNVHQLRDGSFVTMNITNPAIVKEFSGLASDDIKGNACLYIVSPERYWTDLKYGYFKGFGSEGNNDQEVEAAFDEIIAMCKDKTIAICYFE